MGHFRAHSIDRRAGSIVIHFDISDRKQVKESITKKKGQELKVAIYARVSTDDKHQDPDTQLYALREFCKKAEWEIAGEYVDHARAKDFKRRVRWAELLQDARGRNFKAVMVFRLDRAFRSVRECSNTVQEWMDYGIGFKSLREDVIDTTTSQGRFILHIMAAVAELESNIISERVAAGIARTRAQGNRYGRKSKPFDVERVKTLLASGMSISAIARETGYSRARIYRAIKENRDCNLTRKNKPMGFNFNFNHEAITVKRQPVDYKEFIDKVSVNMKIMAMLKDGPKSRKELADLTEKTESHIGYALNELKSKGKVVSVSKGVWGLADESC